VPALINCLHTVRKRVHELVDVTWAVKKLKRRRNHPTFCKAEQQELWEQIQVAGRPTTSQPCLWKIRGMRKLLPGAIAQQPEYSNSELTHA
jgi:hypothetical protein